jgi:hypothetical protein
MKKFLILFYSLLVVTSSFAGPGRDIDEKLVRSFNASFPQARNVNWHQSDDFSLVYFIENGIRSKIAYDKNGTLVQFTRSYEEQNLPYPVQFKVKRRFPDKKIFGITEILTISGQESQVEYYVKMEDAKNWVTTRIDGDGELTIVEKYRKAL